MTDPLVESHNAEAIQAASVAKEADMKARETQMRSMIKDMFDTEFMGAMRDAVKGSIKETVNGKIDRLEQNLAVHNAGHEKDMQRIMPAVEYIEYAMKDVDSARRGGKVVLWLAAMITALGGAYLVLRMIFFNH